MAKIPLSKPILFVDEAEEAAPESPLIEYVGGPFDRQRTEHEVKPKRLVFPDGQYVRSVRCADDGALRYIWHPSGS